MAKILQCTESGCPSMIFTVNLTVGPYGDLAEQPEAIDGEYFVCCECHSEGMWVDDE